MSSTPHAAYDHPRVELELREEPLPSRPGLPIVIRLRGEQAAQLNPLADGLAGGEGPAAVGMTRSVTLINNEFLRALDDYPVPEGAVRFPAVLHSPDRRWFRKATAVSHLSDLSARVLSERIWRHINGPRSAPLDLTAAREVVHWDDDGVRLYDGGREITSWGVTVGPAAVGCPVRLGEERPCTPKGGMSGSGLTRFGQWNRGRLALADAFGCSVCHGGKPIRRGGATIDGQQVQR